MTPPRQAAHLAAISASVDAVHFDLIELIDWLGRLVNVQVHDDVKTIIPDMTCSNIVFRLPVF
jgi:hypothetical protein